MRIINDTVDNDGDGSITVQMGDYIYQMGELDGDSGWLIRCHIDDYDESEDWIGSSEEPVQWGTFGKKRNPDFKFLKK